MNSIAVFIPIVAILSTAWVLVSILNYRKERFTGAKGEEMVTESRRHIEVLANENDRLLGQVSRLEERIATLERIATDPAERTAREIDNLR